MVVTAFRFVSETEFLNKKVEMFIKKFELKSSDFLGNTQDSCLIFYLFRSRLFSKVALLLMSSNVRKMSSSNQRTVKPVNDPFTCLYNHERIYGFHITD